MEATGESSARNLQNKPAPIWLRAVASILSIALVFALLQQFFGIGMQREFVIDTAKRLQVSDGIYRWTLPEAYQSELMSQRGELWENGAAVFNRARKPADLEKRGAGWWNAHGKSVRFVPPDGSDPRTNGRDYTVVMPYQIRAEVWSGLLGALAVCLFALSRCKVEPGEGSRGFPLMEQSTLVFLIALLVLSARVLIVRDFSDDAFVAKDLAESDAGGWHETAAGLADGLGLKVSAFSGQRPLHGVMLSALMAVFGDHTLVARFMNAFMISLAAAGAWCLGAILRSRWLGFALAGVVVLHSDHLMNLHAVLTENSGMAFAVIALLLTWAAAWELSSRWSFLAGIVNALGVLASGVTLFALPFYTLILLANPLLRRAPWQRATAMTALFVAGAACVLLPWMIRQKIAHGQFTLSLNTAEVLAGAASPQGRLSPELLSEVVKLGDDLNDPGKRYAYFMERFKEMVAADPAAFFKHVMRSALGAFDYLAIRDPAFDTAGVLVLLLPALIAGWRGAGVWHLLAAALLTFAWMRMQTEHVLPATVALGFLAWRRARWPEERLGLALVFATILGLMILAGFTGNQVTRRAWTVVDWSVCAVLFLGMIRLVEVAGGFLCAVTSRFGLRCAALAPERRQAVNAPVTVHVFGAVLMILAFSGIAFAITRTTIGPGAGKFDLSSLDKTAAGRALVARHPDLATLDISRIHFDLASFTEMKAPMRAGEDTGHWLPHYRARAFPRVLVLMEWLDDSGRRFSFESAQLSSLPDDLHAGTPALVAVIANPGVNRLDGEPVAVKEIVAVAWLEREADGKWRISETQTAFIKPTPEALTTLKSPTP